MAYLALLTITFLVLAHNVNTQTPGQIEVRRYYTIESFDGSFLSIDGGAVTGVKVVTESPQQASPRQRFWIGRGDTHEIQAEGQNAFSTLVLDLDLTSSLLFQQARNYRRHQWWKITNIEANSNKWAIQNDRTGQCLSTVGKDNQVFGTICDLTSANQTWAFNSL